jgi:hypothetical protein
MKIGFIIFVLLASVLCGCSDKNYSKQKPEVGDLEGTWILMDKSRESVQAASGCKFTANDGILTIRSDGSILAQGFPASPEFKIALFSGTGTWSCIQREEIWKVALQINDMASNKIINVVLDVGHANGKAYLNQAIGDPDGEVMYFDRTSVMTR